MIANEFVIKPILVRVCGESVFGLNYNNSLSLWNFDEYFFKMSRVDEFSGLGPALRCSSHTMRQLKVAK